MEKNLSRSAPPMIIQGGRDYRVPIGQELEAFQAAQLQGIKSKLHVFRRKSQDLIVSEWHRVAK